MSLPHQRHSQTSADAASEFQRTGKALTARQRVRAYILSRGPRGATDKEVQVALEMQGSTQRPRRVELQGAGMVVDSGQKRARSVVWVAVEHTARQLRLL